MDLIDLKIKCTKIRMKKTSSIIANIGLGATVVFGLIFVSGCGKRETAETVDEVRPVRVATLESGGIQRKFEFPGQIQPELQASLAFEVSGRIIEMPVREGELVEEGAVLAILDARDYESKLNAARATLKEAESEQTRNRNLFNRNAGSKEELERSIRSTETARANLEISLKAFEDTRLKALFPGTIARIVVDDFQNVQAKEPVMILQATDTMEAVINIPETIWIQANRSQSLEKATELIQPQIIMTALPDRSFPAQLTEAATTADTATRTFAVTFAFTPPEDINISSGMTAKVTFTIPDSVDGKQTGFAVPVGAVAYSPSGEGHVWRIHPESRRVSKVVVKTGIVSGDQIEIHGALTAGDRIASSGVHSLQEGMKVKPWRQ